MCQNFSHITSELGIEKRCLACRQFWPADSEFFAPRNNRRDPLSQRCRACIAELFWGYSIYPSMPGATFAETAL
jgi:hypothetical protein